MIPSNKDRVIIEKQPGAVLLSGSASDRRNGVPKREGGVGQMVDTVLVIRKELGVTVENWFLTEVHVDGPALTDIPVTRSGNPQVGKFTYSYELTPPTCGEAGTGVTEHTVDVPFVYDDTADFTVYIAAHAELLQCIWHPPVDVTPGYWTTLDETGWGEGIRFPGAHNWGMYIKYEYDYVEPGP